MKKALKIFGGIIIAIIVIGLFVGGGDDTPTTTTEQVEQKASKKEKVEVVDAKIGEVLTVGNVEFTVNSRTEAGQVGDSFLNHTAQGKYLILNVTVTNKDNEAITVDSSLFKLLANGKEYEADSTATLYANEQADFFYTQVNPDLSLSGKVVFDIPAELHEQELTLQVQTGFWGTETGKINLTE